MSIKSLSEKREKKWTQKTKYFAMKNWAWLFQGVHTHIHGIRGAQRCAFSNASREGVCVCESEEGVDFFSSFFRTFLNRMIVCQKPFNGFRPRFTRVECGWFASLRYNQRFVNVIGDRATGIKWLSWIKACIFLVALAQFIRSFDSIKFTNAKQRYNQ